jgi:hypothetical protein
MWASLYKIVFVRFFEDGCQNWTLDWRREEEGQVLRSLLLMGLLRIVRNMTLSWGKRNHSGDDLPSSVLVCLAYFSTHLHHLVQQICSDNCVHYFTIFSSSSCLRKKSTHIAKTCNATLIYMHLLSYHPSIVVATTRWIFYQFAFMYRDSVPPCSLHNYLKNNYFIPILQIRIYPCTREWYCLTKTVEEKIAPLLPSFLQHPPRIPETRKEKFRFIKRKRSGCRWFWWKQL